MPHTAHTRRDPLKGETGLPRNKGFTVIELMIAIAVLAIITSLALPSYRAIIEKRRVTSGTEQIAAFISAAQMEAVKRNMQVAIACTEDACTATVLDDPTADGDLLLRTLDFSGWVADVISVDYGGDDELVIFDPVRGMLTEEDFVPSPLEIQLASPQDMYALNIRMAPTGRITMCSDRIRAPDRAVPGYDDCVPIGD